MVKRVEVGDDIYVWDDPRKIDEFLGRVEQARDELYEKHRITYYIANSYKYHYKRRPSFLYKQTVTGFRPLELGGMPRLKDHIIQFIEAVMPDGNRRARCITSNPEVVAFLDMKQGIVREEHRDLTPAEKQQLEKLRLEKKVAELEAKLAEKEGVITEEKTAEEVTGEQPIVEEKKQRGRPKGKKGDN